MKLNFGRRWLKVSLVGLVAAVLGLGAGVQGVGAQTDPYTPSTAGYDVSYPQCGGAAPTGAFGIIGVNGGRPFSNNGCLAAEYSAAPKSPAASLYINTGYSGAYRKDITSGCATQSKSIAGSSSQRQAWAVGCSEAESSMTYAVQSGAASVAMWWLDVETANSWSSNTSLNRYAIQGAATRLAGSGLPVGVYSSSSMWTAIMGAAFTPSGIEADWETAGGACAASGFTSNPVWLLQSTNGGLDSDAAC